MSTNVEWLHSQQGSDYEDVRIVKEVWILTVTYDNRTPCIINVYESHDGADDARCMLEEINEKIEYYGAKYTIKRYEVYP